MEGERQLSLVPQEAREDRENEGRVSRKEVPSPGLVLLQLGMPSWAKSRDPSLRMTALTSFEL